MKDNIVLRVVANFIIPFILVFGFYIQLHGEYSPGGGFQAGVIVAAAFILFSLLWGMEACEKVVSKRALEMLAACGVLLYAGVGVSNVLMGANFLDYDVMAASAIDGQHLGILLVELGVGITVYASMMLIYMMFVQRKGATR